VTLQTGTEIAGYRIDGVIGAGGMGVVYEATQLALERPVALKVLGAVRSTDEFRARFRREAMLQAALEHPNVVPVYEAGDSEDGLFIAMKLVRGSDLKRLIEGGDLTPEQALELLAQAAEALDAAHAVGLVHRDVKPQNILVDESNHAYLADFGLSKGAGDRGFTLTGAYTGSLDYAAPEQIRGETYGPAADLYAFAAVLCEALTGEVPFPHETEAALLYAHLSEEPPRPSERRLSLPAGLDAVVARGLAKTPDERYGSAAELVTDARNALASQPVSAPTNGRRRFSETIVESPVLAQAPVIALDRERHIPWQTIGLVAVVLLALLLGGFALGRETHGSGGGRLSVAQSGPLSLQFPSGQWKTVRPPTIPGLKLEGAIALMSTQQDRPGTIVAGIAPAAEGVGLLPPALRADLNGAAPVTAVAAGPLRGLEYRNLPAAKVAHRFGLFLVPIPRGAAAVACLAPRVLEAGTMPADCDAVAATLRLHGLRALPLSTSGHYATELSAALTLLDGERLAGRRQLAGATTPAEEARAAKGLQGGFSGLAQRLAGVTPTPFARPGHDTLVAALRNAATQYAKLAQAATAHDEAAYAAAARRVDAAERTVDASIQLLEQLKLP
jgi:predicted Ser/Thr protein kinase